MKEQGMVSVSQEPTINTQQQEPLVPQATAECENEHWIIHQPNTILGFTKKSFIFCPSRKQYPHFLLSVPKDNVHFPNTGKFEP